MRRVRFVAIAAVALAVVFSSVPAAFAGHHAAPHRAPAPFRITKPRVDNAKVVIGVAFDATGTLVPAIAADDASNSVVINAYGPGPHGRAKLVASFPGALSDADTGSAYVASVTLPKAGVYSLVAVVLSDGAVVARSSARTVVAVLPYRVTKPRLVSAKVLMEASFEATGFVLPAIQGDDTLTTVAIQVLRVGRRGRLTLVTTVDAVLTGPVGDGTGYSAMLSLADAGRYRLVAVVMRDGVVLGRSAQRPVAVMPAAPPTAPLMRARRH